MSDLPSHASPILAPQARPSPQYLSSWADHLGDNGPPTPSLPGELISPAFTPPSTPGISTPRSRYLAEPKSTPVDTSTLDPSRKQPRLLERLPVVECVVRARIPTTSGAEMFLHLYQNDADSKEHLAIVFGNTIRSRSLDAERPGETEMDRMIRGAYVGRLRPGRMSSRIEEPVAMAPTGYKTRPGRVGSGLRNVTVPISEHAAMDPGSASQPETQQQDSEGLDDRIASQSRDKPQITAKAEAAPLSINTNTTNPHVTSYAGSPSSIPSHLIQKPPLVRIHSECYTGETAWSARCDCGEQLDEAARLMSLPSSTHHTSSPTSNAITSSPNSPSNAHHHPPPAGGVIVYLRQEGRGIGLASKLRAYNLQDLGSDTVEANLLLRHPADARSYGLATSILVDLGLGMDTSDLGIRLLTNNPEKVVAVEGPGREVRVRERVAMVPVSWRSGGAEGVRGVELQRYLETKVGRMGHRIFEEGEGGGVEGDGDGGSR